MHGVVFSELKEFVETEHGEEQWQSVVESAETSTNSYLAISTYPDDDLVALLEAAETATGQSQETILNSFGRFAAPGLLQKYDTFLDNDWGVLDVLEHTEDAMHKAVRLKEDDAEPPELDCQRASEDEVLIEYTSELQLCKFGEGLINGIVDEYGTTVDIDQTQCMLEGDNHCEIYVHL